MAGVWRACFDYMRMRPNIVKGRQTDTPWVHDQLAFGGTNGPRHMRMSAENQRGLDLSQARLNFSNSGCANLANFHSLQKVLDIAIRSPVT